jgi:hypothetical protein
MEMGEMCGMVGWRERRREEVLEDNNDWEVLTSESPGREEKVSNE